MTDAQRIAVLGVSGRFPGGADSPEALWDALLAGRDLVEEVPDSRWRVDAFHRPGQRGAGLTHPSRWGGFLHGIDQFDAAFFGISPREADAMDPAQRLLLEATWRCWEDAGLAPARWAEHPVGVFIGGFTQDYQLLQLGDPGDAVASPHTATGVMQTLLSNRISHCFHFTGPSLTVDTACSSSLVALHLAVESLRRGDCELALVGAAQLQLAPQYTAIEGLAGMLSPHGRCRAFDAQADGYVRAEAVGMLLLAPLDRALRDGWRRRAEVVATSVNHNGPVPGVTLPDAAAQVRLIATALERAGLSPDAIGYVEAHGTGTRAGDRAEAAALGEALGRRRSGPLWIGSAKTNLGHAEAAAGVVGLIKAILCLEQRRIPPHLHWERAPDDIGLPGLGLRLPVRPEPWPEAAPFAGVNSFGFGGTNAHAILAPPTAATPAPRSPSGHRTPGGSAVFSLAGPTRAHLPLQVAALRDFVAARPDTDGEALATLAAAMRDRRPGFSHRLHLVASDRAGLLGICGEYLVDPEAPRWAQGEAVDGRRLVWVFAGMGAQWQGMGEGLVDAFPVYRQALAACDADFARISGISILEACRRFYGAGDAVLAPQHAQPLTVFFQIALIHLLESWGVAPAAVVGHSLGEIAAFYAAGAIDRETALTLVHHRSRLQGRLHGTGGMLAIRRSEAEIRPALTEPGLAIAAVNGPATVSVAGPRPALEALAGELRRSRIPFRAVPASVAYHSPMMDGIEAEFRAAVAALGFQAPTRPLFSTVTGGRVDEALGHMDAADYWWSNLRAPVAFAPAVKAIRELGGAVFQEISAHPVLLPHVAEATGGPVVATLRRGSADADSVLDSIARLDALGLLPDGPALAASSSEPVATPAYVWQRRGHWSEAPGMRAFRLRPDEHAFLGVRRPGPGWTWDADIPSAPMWNWGDHRVMGRPRVPAAVFLEGLDAAWRAVAGDAPARFTGVRFHRGGIFDEGNARLCTVADPEQGTLRIQDGRDGETLVSATATTALVCGEPRRTGPAPADTRWRHDWPQERFYDALRTLGHDYGPAFRCVESIQFTGTRVWARLDGCAVEGLRFPPVLLDGALQVALFIEFVARGAAAGDRDRLLTGVEEVRLFHPVTAASLPLYVDSELIRRDDDETIGDLVLHDAHGRVLADLRGVTLRALPSPSAFTGGRAPASALFELAWRPLVAAPGAPARGEVSAAGESWIVLADRGSAGARFAEALAAERAVTVRLIRDGAIAEKELSAAVRVVDFRALDDAGPPSSGDGGQLRDMAQRLASTCSAMASPSRLWVITRGAFAIEGEISPLHRALWSLCRAIGDAERMEIFGGVVDLPDPMPEDWCVRLHHLLAAAPPPSQLRLDREGRWWVPALAACPPSPSVFRPRLRADAGYVITGGLGALGAHAADYLAERGARALILVGRTPLPPREIWDGDHPPALRRRIDRVRSLERRGVRVLPLACDVGRAEGWDDLARQVVETGFPIIRGVVHAAGALADKALADTRPEELDQILAPKVAGIHHLLARIDAGALDFLLLYSSIASLLPAYGQAAYAAANGYLEGLAESLCRRGVPARAVGWGPWTIGMAGHARVTTSLRGRGLLPFAPQEGSRILDALWPQRSPCLYGVSADWSQLAHRHPRSAWLLEDMGGAAAAGRPASAAPTAPAMPDLAGLSTAEREVAAIDYLKAMVGSVMGIAPGGVTKDSVPARIGADSLMAVEIQVRIAADWGVDVPVSDLLGRQPLYSLARRLALRPTCDPGIARSEP